MIITLTPEQEKFVLERLQSGQYKSVDEAIDFAFQLLEAYESEKQKERFALFLSRPPYVSDEEQKDIEEHFGTPSDA
jgi:Arc/MetJ-type ribon-helix-helix transcriptional regulator